MPVRSNLPPGMLAHGYANIDLSTIWNTIQTNLPSSNAN